MIENVARALWPLIHYDFTFDEAKAIEDDMGFAWVCDLAKAAIAAMTVQAEPVAWKNYADDGDWWLTDDREPADSCERSVPLYAHPPVPQWQGIETAPMDGGLTTIIAAWRCAHSGQMRVSGDVNNIAWAWFSDSEGIIDPTHWQPLPTPPNGGSDAE